MQTQIGTTPDPLNQSVAPPIAEAVGASRRYHWMALAGIAPIVWLLLALAPSLNRPIMEDALTHVLTAGGAALFGLALALLVLYVANRLEDGRAFLIGMAVLGTASILLIHAIATPNILMVGRGAATAWSAGLSLICGSIFFALSGLDLPPAFNHWLMRHARVWLLIYLIFWLVYSEIFLILLPVTPTAASTGDSAAAQHAHASTHMAVLTTLIPTAPPAWANLLLSGIGLACYAFAITRHYYLYHRSPSQAGLAVICGMAFFAEAIITQQLFTRVYTTAFWFTHLLQLGGFCMIGYTALGAYRRRQAGQPLLESLFLAGTRARLQANYSSALDALVETLSRGERPAPALRQVLQGRLGMAEHQVQVLEHAASAIAQERQQRQELERLNAALRQVEQDKNQLMQMVVHDLKNPLTALVGFLELLRLDSLSGEQMMLVESALRSGKNLSGLSSDLLDSGRIEEGHLELERSMFYPRDLLEECAGEMRAWLIQDGKTLRIEAPDDLPPLQADLRLLRRVILNLVSNAIKHTSSGTTIVLRAGRVAPQSTAAAEQVAFEIEDNGPGIAPEHLEHIFDKFSKLNGQLQSRQASTGLGLTFCRLAVEAHDGTIGVRSVVGQGTTFRLTLPTVQL
jgi:two-component system, OmpR family, sensor kinase